MVEKDWDLASVKILPGKRKTLIEKLQGVEYDIAMQARLLYPWLTSGAGMIAKRETMISIMKNHSLFFNGGDIEIGKLAHMMGYKVGHIPMVFKTDVPETTRKWIKQRFSWMCGAFRHSVINMDTNLHHPFHFIYFTFIIYFLLPLKLYELLSHIILLPILMLIYAVLTYFANWKVRSKWMLIFPIYALFQVTVLLWCGIYRYVVTVKKSGNFGRIRMKHNPNNVSHWGIANIHRMLGKVSFITAVVVVVLLGSSSMAQKVAFGRTYEPMDVISIAYQELTKPDLSGTQILGASTSNLEEPSSLQGTSVSSDQTYYVLIENGDGDFKIAEKAIRFYMQDQNIDLNAEQLNKASMYLQNRINVKIMYVPNSYMGIKKQQIADSIAESLNK